MNELDGAGDVVRKLLKIPIGDVGKRVPNTKER